MKKNKLIAIIAGVLIFISLISIGRALFSSRTEKVDLPEMCRAQLVQIADACTAYADAHNGQAPPSIAALVQANKLNVELFLCPVTGPAQIRAAKKAGFTQTKSLHSVRVGTPDKKGLGARFTCALAEAGINLRGLSAAAIGRKSVMYLAFDTTADATKAVRVLKKL